MQEAVFRKFTLPTLAFVQVFLTALLLAGCSPRKLPAFGSSNDLTVVTNLGDQDEAVSLLKSVFARPLMTEDPDTLYNLVVFSASEFSMHGRRYEAFRNLILLVDISKRDDLTKRIEYLLGTNVTDRIRRSGAEYFVRSDVWALSQTLAIIAGEGTESLNDFMTGGGDKLYAEVDSLVTERTRETVYAGGEQSSATKGLFSNYGWGLRLPVGFRASPPDSVENGLLISLRADRPARLVSVYYAPIQNGERPDRDKCLELRASLAWAAYDEDVADHARTITRTTQFEGREALRIEGACENKKSGARGTFFTYCFCTKDRFYLIDAVIYAPGARKGALIKQLEAIVTTFKG